MFTTRGKTRPEGILRIKRCILTFARLSVGSEAVARATAAGPGLVAATQQADVGTPGLVTRADEGGLGEGMHQLERGHVPVRPQPHGGGLAWDLADYY